MPKRSRLKKRRRASFPSVSGRRLRFEGLEDRRLLATLTVGAYGANSENPTSSTVNNGVLTLREAIDYVNQTAIAFPLDAQRINTFGGTQPLGVNDKIVFDSSLNGQMINLLSGSGRGQLTITRSVIIDATMLADGLTVNGATADPTSALGDGITVMEITVAPSFTSIQVTLAGLTITGGDSGSTLGGGGIRYYSAGVADCSLTIRDCRIVDNYAHFSGGGIYVSASRSPVIIEDSILSGNTARLNGGGIYNYIMPNGSLTITDSQITGNLGTDGGGLFARAIANTANPFPASPAITISRTLVSGNTASNRGGGVYTRNYNGTETLLEEVRVTGNHVLGGSQHRNGGGIYAYVLDNSNGINKPRFTITGSTVDNNDAEHEGGGIFVCAKFFGEFVATNSTISGNHTTDGGGGGIFIARFDEVGESVDAYLQNITVTQKAL